MEYLLEMNPRFWGALNLAVRNGFDFPAALVSLATGGAADSRWFTARPPVRSLLDRRRVYGVRGRCPARTLEGSSEERRPVLAAGSYDDFRAADPLPLFLELAYYLTGFVRSNGDINPVSVGMIALEVKWPVAPAPHNTAYARFGKRTIDLVIAVPAVLALGLPMSIVAAAIRLSCGRPVFFAQLRIGRFGGTFRIFKFRTMTAGAPRRHGTIAGDPRITRLGASCASGSSMNFRSYGT